MALVLRGRGAMAEHTRRSARSPWFMPIRAAMLLSLVCCLTGCPTEGDPAPAPQPPPRPAPPPVPDNVAQAVILALFEKKGLKFKRPQQREKELDDLNKGYFIRRRVRTLLGLNPAWATNLDLLKQRVDAEFDSVQSYLGLQLGADTLGDVAEGGSTPGPADEPYAAPSDKHINLMDAARATLSTTDAQAKLRARQLVELRRRRVSAILWRAAAIDDRVFSPPGSQLVANAAVVPEKLKELLDRRLRSVERMSTQIATHMYIDGGYARVRGESEPTVEPVLRIEGQTAWFDDFRGRPFEYPRVTARQNVVTNVLSGGTHRELHGKGVRRRGIQDLALREETEPPRVQHCAGARYSHPCFPQRSLAPNRERPLR